MTKRDKLLEAWRNRRPKPDGGGKDIGSDEGSGQG
jgi:hypothetical protein